MSIFDTLRRAMGFDRDDDDTYNRDDDSNLSAEPAAPAATAEPAATPAPAAVGSGDPAIAADAGLVDIPVLPEVDPAMKARIFEGVVKVFNSALPDFIARSVNPEAQQRLLLESLDTSLDAYLTGLMLSAEQYAEKKLKGASESSRREAERLRTQMQQLEQQRSALREQQLSADRRRRALSERVSDLEAQLAQLEADREQLQLENKSMLNKLKLADIQPNVVDDMSRRIEELEAALAAGNQPAGADALAEANEQLIRQKQLTEQAIRERDSAAAQAKQLAETLDNIKDNGAMSQAMYNDLHEKLTTERETRQALEAELDEARKLLEQVSEMQEQFRQVEQLIHRRDERISKLKAENKRLHQTIDDMEARMNADDGLFGTAGDTAAPGQETEVRTASPRVEIGGDDDFDIPEWFASDPGPAAPAIPHESDPNFGYTEPKPKPRHPESDAQMSLF